MKKDGTGGGRTITGLKFESKVAMKNLLASLPGYKITGDIVHYQNKKIAEFFEKHKLYKNLLEANGISYHSIISQKLLPDEAILILSGKTLFIIEVKSQEVPGSVDEKLQTCDFKNKQYRKLLSPLGISVKYVYILSDWFKKQAYSDVLEYIQSVGCYYTTFNQEVQRLGFRNKFLIEENGLFRHLIFESSSVDLSTSGTVCRNGAENANFLARIIKSLHFLIELGYFFYELPLSFLGLPEPAA